MHPPARAAFARNTKKGRVHTQPFRSNSKIWGVLTVKRSKSRAKTTDSLNFVVNAAQCVVKVVSEEVMPHCG